MTTAKRRAAVEITVFILAFLPSGLSVPRCCIPLMSPLLRMRFVVYSNLVKFLLWVVPAILFVQWVRRTSPYAYLGLSVLPSKKQWQICLGSRDCLSASLLQLRFWWKAEIFILTALPVFTIRILFHFLSPWMEEVLFRGCC